MGQRLYKFADSNVDPLLHGMGFSIVAFFLGLLLSAIAGIFRGVVFLKTATWLWSGCQVAGWFYPAASGYCTISTDWHGVDVIVAYLTTGSDLSFALVILALVALAFFILFCILGWINAWLKTANEVRPTKS